MIYCDIDHWLFNFVPLSSHIFDAEWNCTRVFNESSPTVQIRYEQLRAVTSYKLKMFHQSIRQQVSSIKSLLKNVWFSIENACNFKTTTSSRSKFLKFFSVMNSIWLNRLFSVLWFLVCKMFECASHRKNALSMLTMWPERNSHTMQRVSRLMVSERKLPWLNDDTEKSHAKFKKRTDQNF